MKIDNINSLKHNNKPIILGSAQRIVKNAHSQSFGSGAAGNAVISVMDAIERGGFVAAFLVQDLLGMNVPRTTTGLYRNREITGQYNYQEAAEVGIREFLSGPVMFAVPMIMLWAVKRMFGKANDIPANIIKALGDNFAEYSKGKTTADFKDVKAVKESFYSDLFKNILKNTYAEGTPEETISKEAKAFAKEVLEYENLIDTKKRKTFWQRFKGVRVENTAEDKLADLTARFSEINKSNAANSSINFLEAKISSGDKKIGKSIDKLVGDMRNFVEDAVETVSKRAKKGLKSDIDMSDFFKKFTNLRAGSRVITNFSMLAGIVAFCSVIPKLYQLSETNPGLNGLEDDAKADDKVAQNKSQKPAFKGLCETIGKRAVKDGKLSKFLSEFEFDSFNTSFLGFLTACGFGILLPRLKNAREENEYKEVLYRDTTTITTVCCAAKILQQVFARFCSKMTGLALSLKPDMKMDTTISKIWSYLRPVKGHKVLTSAQLASKYTNVDKYKEGIAGLAKFVDEQGGNVRKMFEIDKKAKGLLKELYENSDKAKSVEFAKAQNKDVIEALQDVVKNNKASDTLNKLYDIFKSDKNAFLRKAKIMNSSFNFATIFVVCPILLGWFIPRMNEELTKKRQLEKHEHNKSAVNNNSDKNTQKVSDVSKTHPIALSPSNMKNTSVAFKEFIAP